MTELYCDKCGKHMGYESNHPRGYTICIDCGEEHDD